MLIALAVLALSMIVDIMAFATLGPAVVNSESTGAAANMETFCFGSAHVLVATVPLLAASIAYRMFNEAIPFAYSWRTNWYLYVKARHCKLCD